jgi:hypothetical protein
MPWVGFEPTIPAFERTKTVQAVDGAAAVFGVTLSRGGGLKYRDSVLQVGGWAQGWRPCSVKKKLKLRNPKKSNPKWSCRIIYGRLWLKKGSFVSADDNDYACVMDFSLKYFSFFNCTVFMLTLLGTAHLLHIPENHIVADKISINHAFSPSFLLLLQQS